MSGKNIKEFLAKHYRYVIVGGLFVVLVVVLIIFLIKGKDSVDVNEENVSTIPEMDTTIEVPKDKYEEDAYPAVNTLVSNYLDAMSNGDTDTMASLSSSLSDDEKAFYQAQAQYVENYSDYKVYTKKGPAENSYFLLATYNLRVKDIATPLPALLSLYVCKNESGDMYINNESLSSDEETYILQLVAQKDFADLIDQVDLDYNAAIEADESLATATAGIKDEINRAAQQILTTKQQEEMEAAAQAEAAAQQEAMAAAATKVRCTDDNVNIRSSASTDAEILGKTTKGAIYTRYEKMENGWSKVEYDGGEAYIKSDYLEDVPEESGDNVADAGTAAPAEAGGTITIKENVNVRKGPNQESDIINTATRGETYDLISREDGWCKINYKGQEAYVKADYVE